MANERQIEFLNQIREVSNQMQLAYQEIKELSEHFAEEFATTQDNALDGAGAADELTNRGLTYSVVLTAINQGFNNFINFWEGAAVTTREYGKDIRRIG